MERRVGTRKLGRACWHGKHRDGRRVDAIDEAGGNRCIVESIELRDQITELQLQRLHLLARLAPISKGVSEAVSSAGVGAGA